MAGSWTSTSVYSTSVSGQTSKVTAHREYCEGYLVYSGGWSGYNSFCFTLTPYYQSITNDNTRTVTLYINGASKNRSVSVAKYQLRNYTEYYTITDAEPGDSIVLRWYDGGSDGSGWGSYCSATVTLPSRPSWTVTFNANGGTGEQETGIKYYDHEYVIPECTFVRSGYAFTAWNTAADGSGATYIPGATYTTDANLTLYARWKALAKSYIKIHGTWTYVTDIGIKPGNSWKTVVKNYVKVNDTWKETIQ